MPPSAPLNNDQLASNSIEAKWLVKTKSHFFELSKIAFQWPPVSPTFCFTGVDPKSIYKITYGIISELDNTLVRLPWYPRSVHPRHHVCYKLILRLSSTKSMPNMALLICKSVLAIEKATIISTARRYVSLLPLEAIG